MIIEEGDALRTWLTITTEPICDADPAALARYVMALLKKDKTEQELKQNCIDQLEVFLQKETISFVDRLFDVIHNKSYISATKIDESTAIDVDKTNTANRRDLSPMKDDRGNNNSSTRFERDHRRRDRDNRVSARIRSRSRDQFETSRSRREQQTQQRRRSKSRSPIEQHKRESNDSGTSSSTLIGKTETTKPERCRDYDERGYCMRGDRCIYDHGPDPVVVDDTALDMMVNRGMTAPPLPNCYAPRPPAAYVALNPPPPGVDGIYIPQQSAALPFATVTNVPSLPIADGYNPEAPALSAAPTSASASLPQPDFTVPPPPLPSRMTSATTWAPPTYSMLPTSAIIRPAFDGAFPKRGGRRLTGRLGPPIQDRHLGSTSANDNKTLEVRKIPPHLNNIATLNEHFAQFGSITNIQVRYDGDPEAALITYATRQQAIAAYRSTSPILNNRFIRVFWHGGSATDPEKLSAATNDSDVSKVDEKAALSVKRDGSLTKTVYNSQQPHVSSSSIKENSNDADAQRKRRKLEDKAGRARILELVRIKTTLLSRQLESQKLLIEQMQKVSDEQRKKQLYKVFKIGDQSVKRLRLEIDEFRRSHPEMTSSS